MTGDLIKRMGFAAFGCRLRRLSERIDREAREIYQGQGVYFDPSWFPVFAVINQKGPVTLADLALESGLNLSALSILSERLKKEALIVEVPPAGARLKPRLGLTAKGQALIQHVKPIWDAFAKASQALCNESAPEILSLLETVEVALDRRSLSKRVVHQLSTSRPD